MEFSTAVFLLLCVGLDMLSCEASFGVLLLCECWLLCGSVDAPSLLRSCSCRSVYGLSCRVCFRWRAGGRAR